MLLPLDLFRFIKSVVDEQEQVRLFGLNCLRFANDSIHVELEELEMLSKIYEILPSRVLSIKFRLQTCTQGEVDFNEDEGT